MEHFRVTETDVAEGGVQFLLVEGLGVFQFEANFLGADIRLYAVLLYPR